MHIDEDPNTVVGGPLNGLLKVCILSKAGPSVSRKTSLASRENSYLTLDERFASRDVERPISNGYPNVVESSRRDISEILFGDPSIPMVLKSRRGGGFALERGERPFVDNVWVVRVVEEIRRYPWLLMKRKSHVISVPSKPSI